MWIHKHMTITSFDLGHGEDDGTTRFGVICLMDGDDPFGKHGGRIEKTVQLYHRCEMEAHKKRYNKRACTIH
jgi:hypothetical protein